MKDTKIVHIKVEDLFKHYQSLIDAHYEECSDVAEKLDIDKSSYFDIEKADVLKAFAYVWENKVIGYATFFLMKDIKNRTPRAVADAIYLHPDFRGKGYGNRFINLLDDQLKEWGCRYVVHQVTKFVDFSKTMEKSGYEAMSINYLKDLNGSEDKGNIDKGSDKVDLPPIPESL